ncbi:MAG: hypothetical protein A4E65_03510 [Syntrophorhabdus sp. PtaU1.Bin153]|nr:MAG: hypothetical protein A4E65_03510 [Syntrophorhabdus sp. PtaU1.Bin153]
MRSRSASELLLTQKTELPRLSTVCSGIPRHLPNDICGLIESEVILRCIAVAFLHVVVATEEVVGP